MDQLSQRFDDAILSDDDISKLLELHKEYAEESLKYLSDLETRDRQENYEQIDKISNKHPQTSRKYIPMLQPMENTRSTKNLKLERSDGIAVELKCPICQLGSFDTTEKFLQHLTDSENIPLFQDEDELDFVQHHSDMIALEFGTVLPISQQTPLARSRINKLEKASISPSTQLYIPLNEDTSNDENNNSQQDRFKFLRKRVTEGGKDFDNLLREITE